MKEVIFILLLLNLNLSGSFSQPLSAFIDNRNGFSVFDNGTIKQIDFQKPLDYKIGEDFIAYRDASKSFKVYHNGAVKKVNAGLTSQYQVTTDFVFMINSTTLHVYDGENDQFLIRGFTSYFVADSIIGFEDVLARKYFLYTNGVIFPLVDDIVHNPIQVVAAGDNIVCYKSADDSFRIFYHNQYYTLKSIYADSVKASKNIVAYTDHYDDLLRIFFKDHEIIPEKFPVTGFATGSDIVAYETQDRQFNIFYNGNIYNMGNFNPQFLRMRDDLVVYTDDLGYSHVFYHGKDTQLEKYLPNKIMMGRHTLFYYDASNLPIVFSFGTLTELPLQNYLDVQLDFDVLRLQTGQYDYRFFYKGKTY